jgi:predicted GH43/DUF377 family glycosyl hydrolase
MFELQRYKNNPILTPIKEHRWESRAVFNPAAVIFKNKIYLVYRAIGEDMFQGSPISRLGLAVFKKDGVTLEKRLPYPIYEPQAWYEPAGCEDPRITKINGKYFMLYTAYLGKKTPPFFEKEATNIAMASTTDFKTWERYGLILPEVIQPEKNGVLFPKKIKGYFVIYYRVDPDIYVAYSKSLENPRWIGHKKIISPRDGWWDSWKIGSGAPPIETPLGWLLIYHGVEEKMPPRREIIKKRAKAKLARIYRLGVILIDKKNPEKIIYRSKNPILEPKEKYEKEGEVPNVVFCCGAVVVQDELFVYYGGADTVVGVAKTKLSTLLKKIKRGEL